MERHQPLVIALLLAMAPLHAAQGQRTPADAVTCTGVPASAGRQGGAPAWPRDTSAVQTVEWAVSLGARRVPAKVIAVRVDVQRVALSLHVSRDDRRLLPWTIDQAPAEAVIAVNAGQFTDAGPWGWVVHRGTEVQAPGAGVLAGAFVVARSGAVSIVEASDIPRMRAGDDVLEAVQSYPTLLGANAAAPAPLCARNGTIDLDHRDTRLAIGVFADGDVLIAMTRYDGAGAVGERLPIGPTTPEMAEIMRRLGARQALMLDGGLSAQMRVQAGSHSERWAGLRTVPLGLVGVGRR